MDEVEAVARLKQGDIGGLETLVRKYQVRAIRAAYLVTYNRLLAEDIVQSAFLRAFERIDQLDARRPFGPWFLRGVVNDAVKASRRRQREVSLDGGLDEDGVGLIELLADPDPGPVELLEQAEARRTVLSALERLPPPQRAATVLRYYLDLKEAEIAGRLRWPVGTVKWRLHDARERLRRFLTGPLAAETRDAWPTSRSVTIKPKIAPLPTKERGK